MLAAVLRMTPTAISGPPLILGASAFDGAAQAALWAAALAIDYLGRARWAAARAGASSRRTSPRGMR